MKKNISIFGLGKLGTPIAVALASRGFKIIGVDINKKVVNAINSKKFSLYELHFDSLFKKCKKNIIADTSYKNAINKSDITFVIVPTPSKKNGLFDNKYLKTVIKDIAPFLRKKKKYHLISILSTVVPGSMMNEIQPLLEKKTGKKIGKNIGLCYNPSFIALGTVIENFLKPDFVLIGESDKKTGDKLEQFYKKVCTNKPLIKRMNFINAEITKLALNTFVTTKISYANMLAELCETLPGAHVDIVTNAIGTDSRIGYKYLKGTIAYGGPCFPRDNKALTAIGKKAGITLSLPQITDKINSHQVKRIVSLLQKHTPKKGNITILGITYQTESDVVEGSSGVKLAQELMKSFKITIYDPTGIQNAQLVLGDSVIYSKGLKHALKNADSIVITTNAKEFATIPEKYISKTKPLLIDCWRTISSPDLKNIVEYYALGVGQKNEK